MADIELVIFDWDGTLMDSLDQIVHSVRQAADELGVERPSTQAARDIIGLGLPEAMRVLFPTVPEHDRAALRERYARHFVASSAQVRPYAGIPELLDVLGRAAVPLAVATGKSRKGLDRVLGDTGWRHRFRATRCADETASKPHPRMLQELLEELRVPVSRAVMVGDTSYDLGMAQAIGMASVGVTYGVHDAQRLSAFAPRQLCPDVASLRACLQQLTGVIHE